MTRQSPSFLDALTVAAEHANAAEDSYRREAAKHTIQLATDRAFAFRRLNLMQTVANAESQEVAVSITTAIPRAKLGWSSDSEARDAVLLSFAAVSQVVFAHLPVNDTKSSELSVLKALADFEDWYEQAHPRAFLVLFENEMRETPVVDF